MRFAIAVVLILGMISPALGAPELVVRLGENEIRIQGSTCEDKKVLSWVKPEFHGQFKKASVKLSGKGYAACWTMLPSGEVLILDETGDHGTIPQNAFKPVAWI